ncbi:MAG: oligoendopeptidase F [Verrucomicrobiota bacterium]|nr:oligoendopeptidase F [Verrucomicrobiota bacterium]
MPPTRNEIPTDKKWNVEALYSTPHSWTEELAKAKGQETAPRWPELKSFQGRLGDPRAMTQFMDRYLSLDRMLTKLGTYAHLRLDEDLGNDEFKRNFGLILGLSHDFRLETAWLEPEILSLSDAEVARLMQEPSLKNYRFYFERILTMRPHTLSSDKEELLALAGKALDSSSKAFQALNNVDLQFDPAVDSAGKEHPLTNGTYSTYIHSPDRALRKSTLINLHRGFLSHANTLCELLQGKVQAHAFNAKARQFPNSVTAALFDKKIDPAVIRQLISTVRRGKGMMEDYLALRKKVLQVDAIHAYDLMAPLVHAVDRKMSYEQACETVIASVAPLGADYQANLRKGLLEDRWVDPFENARKRSGAYSSGCYDSMPYILMNFHGTLADTMTLAHEAGHSMHSYLSRKHQPYIYSDYSIFVAEVASTFNEQLLMDHLMEGAKTKEEKAYLISDQIDRIRGTLFRQTLFAEFELKIHELAEQGQPLTPSLLNQIYATLLRDYYGSQFAIDPEIEVEWARIPHFYSNFYVYQYATGVSAAMALHSQVTKSTKARDKYLAFLSSGGSKYPLDLLKEAGVDMTTASPVEAALKRFEYLLGELKKNL